MDYIEYSIIYGVIRQEISERISLGLIYVEGDKVSVRYSQEKIDVLRMLFSKAEVDVIEQILKSMVTDHTVNSIDTVNYLTRYSNNLITVSPLQRIELNASETNQDWLFQNYVYNKAT